MPVHDSSTLAKLHDIIVIGAGPASLALCARLCEPTPSALFTDEEHRRYHWIKPTSPTFQEHGAAKKKQKKKRTWSTGSTGLPTPPSSTRSSISSASPLSAEEESDSREDLSRRLGQGQTLGAYSTLVLDAQTPSSSPRFLERWHTLFSLCGIPHLRSPLFFHLDPADRDSLLTYACNTGRYSECVEIGGVVGKEVSKHARKQKSKHKARAGEQQQQQQQYRTINERDRQDYYTPSTELFADHCTTIVQRYGLDENALIRGGTVVTAIDYDYASAFLDEDDCCAMGLHDNDRVFRVQTISSSPSSPSSTATTTTTTTTNDAPPKSTIFYARAVICATGPNIFTLPQVTLSTPAMTATAIQQWQPRYSASIAIHSTQMTTFPAPPITAKLRRNEPTTAAVIGGGLTAAQLTSALLAAGVQQVVLLIRSPHGMQVKPFDVSVAWMSKFKNARKAEFWGADGGDEERAAMIREARGGGSITAAWAKRLKAFEREGRLRVLKGTCVVGIDVVSGRGGRCVLQTKPDVDADERLSVDYVYFATGAAGSRDMYEATPRQHDRYLQRDTAKETQPDTAIPLYLRTMQAKHPIPWTNSLPSLTDDLSWHVPAADSTTGARTAIPLYMTGALAALRLGPGAANLEGARTGAERIAWAIEDLPFAGAATGTETGIEREQEMAVDEWKEGHGLDYVRGVGGRYGALAGIED